MQFIDNMYQHARLYWQDVPSNTLTEMIYAFGTGFFVATVIRTDPIKGLIAGSLSAVATAIHGLVTPFFKRLTGGRDLTWGEEMCRTLTGIVTVGCAAAVMGHSSIIEQLPGMGLIFGIVTYLDPSRCSIHNAAMVWIFPRYAPAGV